MTMGWMRKTDGTWMTTTYILDQLVVYRIDPGVASYPVSRKVVAAAVPRFDQIGVGSDMDHARAIAEKDWEEGIL